MAEQLPHTEAVLELFSQTNRPVGDAQAPKDLDDLVENDYPYTVIYDLDIEWWRMQGPFSTPQADKQFLYQVIYIGRTRRQVQMLAERGRALVAPENIQVLNHSTRDFRLEQLGRVLRDDDIRPAIFNISDTYLLDITPSGG